MSQSLPSSGGEAQPTEHHIVPTLSFFDSHPSLPSLVTSSELARREAAENGDDTARSPLHQLFLTEEQHQTEPPPADTEGEDGSPTQTAIPTSHSVEAAQVFKEPQEYTHEGLEFLGSIYSESDPAASVSSERHMDWVRQFRIEVPSPAPIRAIRCRSRRQNRRGDIEELSRGARRENDWLEEEIGADSLYETETDHRGETNADPDSQAQLSRLSDVRSEISLTDGLGLLIVTPPRPLPSPPRDSVHSDTYSDDLEWDTTDGVITSTPCRPFSPFPVAAVIPPPPRLASQSARTTTAAPWIQGLSLHLPPPREPQPSSWTDVHAARKRMVKEIHF
uniref:Uncharacterized protein n=1 Tax=Chromera velia CCMP2878 TaxID=1169474 RepID=A0A0G4HNJ3_9ALVE|eukprot:Cvel_29435.t1-p1 / transcript=Cvel_29435.t1 / gene=Cvel_29435 / organism=Chromera_velia_CCMP2878 / gene_product=hypothetical protein / transcript_product=hypothetical protein / location=Cvel_scaffold4022:2780-3781(+) / protein_length=334 / sequence_SO=supercontig / SO=protein_coding / is_pseudo=false